MPQTSDYIAVFEVEMSVTFNRNDWNLINILIERRSEREREKKSPNLFYSIEMVFVCLKEKKSID